MTTLLKLSQIVTDAGTQIRAKIDPDTVDSYAEAMLDASNKFPPVVVFHDGSQYVLADGFHRVMAASRNGFLDIEAEINKGTRSDALKFALGSNAKHGLKRTNADKRRCVELALGEWPKLSNREIARICAVSDVFVSSERNQLLTVSSSENETRIGADGKERKMPTRKTEPKPIDEPNPEVSAFYEAEQREQARLQSEAEANASIEPGARDVGEINDAPISACVQEMDCAIEDLRIVIERLNAFEVDPETLEACAEELTKTAKMLRKLAKEKTPVCK